MIFKKKFKLLVLLTPLLLLSCVSETERGVLDDIAEVYNGDVTYTKSFVSNTKGKNTTFNVFIKNSTLGDTLPRTVSTANAAVMIFDALTDDEKTEYSHVQVSFISTASDTLGYTYKVSELAPVNHKSKIFHDFSKRIVNKNFEGLDALKSNKDIPKSMSVNIKSGLSNTEKEHGLIQSYTLFGIAEETDDIGKLYQFQSYLLFADGHTLKYLVVIDATEGNDKIVGYRFFD
ncbi:hypothetical protein [Rasiella sp. SM2506]|uniref:hypothetical protein n=1 Tax=Rasiella sp. SM2506 TaxID=3423914 RepID=UPI003D7ABB93